MQINEQILRTLPKKGTLKLPNSIIFTLYSRMEFLPVFSPRGNLTLSWPLWPKLLISNSSPGHASFLTTPSDTLNSLVLTSLHFIILSAIIQHSFTQHQSLRHVFLSSCIVVCQSRINKKESYTSPESTPLYISHPTWKIPLPHTYHLHISHIATIYLKLSVWHHTDRSVHSQASKTL